MSKKASNFQHTSHYSNRDTNTKPKQWRSGASNGSHDMADGLASDMTEVRKLRMITQVEVMYKNGKIGDVVSCPICDVSMKTVNFGGHVRCYPPNCHRVGLPLCYRVICAKFLV